ncbi:MAG TPA: L,D-transpeptidase family protein [Sphingomicrobium sp.]|jgi:lipoprotein-anchoring transpeptidase ErfK/SrfK
MHAQQIDTGALRRVATIMLSLSCASVMLAAAVPVFAAEQPQRIEAVAPHSPVGVVIEAQTLPARQAPATPVAAEPEPDDELRAKELKPGTFVWAEEQASGDAALHVSISEQRAYLYRGGKLAAVTTVSTGRNGHATPTGTFRITEKRAVHFSNKYDNAPMPFMQRLTNDGVALHAGHIPGKPASHGCVRLPRDFAQKLFKVTKVGTEVVIAA